MKKFTRSGVKSGTLAFLSVFGITSAISLPPAQADGSHVSKLPGDCYPGTTNHFSVGEDPTSASGSGKGVLEEIEYEAQFNETNIGGATVVFWFQAKVNNGFSPLQGDLTVQIYWDNPDLTGGVKKTEFETGCAQEIKTEAAPEDNGNGNGEVQGEAFEAEFEGSVQNFPFFKGTEKASVASINVKKDDKHEGKLKATLAIDLGITCYEDNGGAGDNEITNIIVDDLDPALFNIANVDRIARSFPPNKTPDTCESFDVDSDA